MGLNLESKITLDSAAFKAGIGGVEKSVHSVAHTLKSYALGAIGVYTVHSAFEATLDTVKELIRESKRMGISVESVQVIAKAAHSANLEVGAVAAAFERLNTLRAVALGGGAGSGKAMAAFNKLGVSSKMLVNQDASQIAFGAIRDKILSVNPQEIIAPLRTVFGKAGGAMIPMLQKDIEHLREHMEKAGMLISTKTANELKEMDGAVKQFKNILVTMMAPVIVALVEKFLALISGTNILAQSFSEWVFLLHKWSGKGEAQQKFGNKLLDSFNQSRGEIPKNKTVMSIIENFGGSVDNSAAQAAVAGIRLYGSDEERDMLKGFTTEIDDKDYAKKFNEFVHGLMEPYNKSVEAASNASDGAIQGIRAMLEKFKKGDYGAVKATNFKSLVGANAPEMKTRKSSGQLAKSDSLVAVGNFLGASRDVMSSAQGAMLKHAADTAKNTEKAAKALETTNELLGDIAADMGGSGEETLYPSN